MWRLRYLGSMAGLVVVAGVVWVLLAHGSAGRPDRAATATYTESVAATPSTSSPDERLDGRSRPRPRTREDGVVEQRAVPAASPSGQEARARRCQELARELHDATDASVRFGGLQRVPLASGLATLCDTITSWMELNAKEPRVPEATLRMARSVTEYALSRQDEAELDLVEALVAIEPPLERAGVATARREPANLYRLATSDVMSPTAFPGGNCDGWMNHWERIVLKSPEGAAEYVDWLLTLSDDTTKPEVAMAASIWAHALAYADNWPYFRSMTPAQVRLLGVGPTGPRSKWSEADVIQTKAAWRDWLSEARQRDEPLSSEIDDALRAAASAGELDKNLLVPWSLEREVLHRMTDVSSTKADRLRRLARWLVQREVR